MNTVRDVEQRFKRLTKEKSAARLALRRFARDEAGSGSPDAQQ